MESNRSNWLYASMIGGAAALGLAAYYLFQVPHTHPGNGGGKKEEGRKEKRDEEVVRTPFYRASRYVSR